MRLVTNCISRINNTQVDDADDTDVVMPIFNVIEYCDNYSKTSGTLWQRCRDEPALGDNSDFTNFNVANYTTGSFKIKEKLTGETGDDGAKNVEIIIPLK